ncbi:MAG: HNH endonuclease [Ktedonobacteraceae bacterium]
MRITFQPSGGRGEYELSDYAPNGIKPGDLLDNSMQLRIGEIILYPGIKLTKDQGKYRLRVEPKGTHPQVQLQLANALLMPHPIREEPHMGAGELVLQNNSYIIKNIHFGEIIHLEDETFFKAEVLTVECKNQTIEAEQIAVQKRIGEIEKIWRQRDSFPLEISTLLRQHETLARAKKPIPKAADQLIENLQKLMERYCTELEYPYTRTTDVVPALLYALGEVIEDRPTSLDQIEPEQIEVRLRERIKWQIWARRRGAASVRFRNAVRTAYQHRCVMCGGIFPSTKLNDIPGVDAAHILPWADYELDEVYNGVTLCKIHHWAFDEGILLILFREGKYYIELSEAAKQVLSEPSFSIDILRQVVGEIPKNRLPNQVLNWPKPSLLERRNEELIQSFSGLSLL